MTRNLRHWPVLFSVLALVFGFALSQVQFGNAQAGTSFYVDPRGNDGGAGTKTQPFATIARARDAVRALKRKQGGKLNGPVTVFLRGGVYELSEPLTFTPEDSGSAQAPVTYAAYEQEQPVISGGRAITGWKPVNVNGKQLWAADLPDVRQGRWYFRQLWVNGQRRYRAHAPNQGFFHAASVPGLAPRQARQPRQGRKKRRRMGQGQGLGQQKQSPGFSGGQDSLQYTSTDLRPYDNLEDVEIVVPVRWMESRFHVAGLDQQQQLVRFAEQSKWELIDRSGVTRYFVENAMELLDSPGEWYLNRKTGVLYYWPVAGENLATAQVIAPRLPQLVDIDGDPSSDRSVEYLNFRGLTFAYAEGWLPPGNIGFLQGATDVPGMIHAEGMHACSFERCTLAHASNYGFDLDLGCQQNRIVSSQFTDLGGGAMLIGPRQHIKPQQARIREYSSQEETRDNQITDNVIRQVGQIFHSAGGIMILQSSGNLIAHNDISDLYDSAISVGFTWGYQRSFAHHNVVEYNRIHNVGQHYLSDLAGIYTLGVQPGTVIRNNVVSDVYSFDYGAWGIYLDQGSSQIRVENNLAYRTSQGGFHLNYGLDNVLTNNIFALGGEMMVRRSRRDQGISFRFDHNIVYWEQGMGLAGKFNDRSFEFDYNDYFTPAGKGSFAENFDWSQWQGRGNDSHSLFADPRFVDPARNDFSLRPDSPALRLGFKPLDLKGVGPRN